MITTRLDELLGLDPNWEEMDRFIDAKMDHIDQLLKEMMDKNGRNGNSQVRNRRGGGQHGSKRHNGDTSL